MDEAAVNDLKQFLETVIKSSVRQTFKEEFDERLDKRLAETEARMEAHVSTKIDQAKHEILIAVADTMQNHIDVTDERLSNHEKRLRKLEHKTA